MNFPPLTQQHCHCCRYFRPRPGGYEGGICRRTAPQIGPRDSEWPSVNPADWCGEWCQGEVGDG